MESENNYNDLRAASFAVYLNSADDSFVKRLGDSARYPASSREDMHFPVGSVKITTREGEIGVFGAEKYFNMNVDDGPLPRLIDDYSRKVGYKKDTHVDPYAGISKSRSATASVISESSWNSHAALLRRFQKSPIQNKQSGLNFNAWGLFRRLACNRSCSDKKSTHVTKEDAQKHQPQPPIVSGGRNQCPPASVQIKDELQCSSFDRASTGSKRDDLFSFPILGNVLHKKSDERHLPKDVGTQDVKEDPRKSIEVFGSGHKDKKKVDVVAMNLERKLSILTWDAIPKPHCPKASAKSSILNDDLESEASSDLFEIENISGNTSVAPQFAQQPPDGLSVYEPSEASIEWSVITASAADFSAVSEYDEKEVQEINFTTTSGLKVRASAETEGVRNRLAGGSGATLGCKSQKSVRVAETAVKTNDKPKIPQLQRPYQRFDSTIHGGKLLIDDKVK